jgi:hypothetical protein
MDKGSTSDESSESNRIGDSSESVTSFSTKRSSLDLLCGASSTDKGEETQKRLKNDESNRSCDSLESVTSLPEKGPLLVATSTIKMEPPYPVKHDPTARALDDWVPVEDSFLDMKMFLNNKRENLSEVDRILKFVLEQKFFVRCLNVVSIHRGSLNNIDDVIRSCPNYKIGPFSLVEQHQVAGRWDQLIRDAEIREPIQLLRDFNAIKKV